MGDVQTLRNAFLLDTDPEFVLSELGTAVFLDSDVGGWRGRPHEGRVQDTKEWLWTF